MTRILPFGRKRTGLKLIIMSSNLLTMLTKIHENLLVRWRNVRNGDPEDAGFLCRRFDLNRQKQSALKSFHWKRKGFNHNIYYTLFRLAV